jgi:hypothetical protein
VPEIPSTVGGYPSLSGVYTGNLLPTFPSSAAGTMIPFTLNIQHQSQQKISGSFSAPSYRNGRFQNDTVSGTVTPDGHVQFIVIDNSGNAVLSFHGRLTVDSSTSDPLGGGFSGCSDNQNNSISQSSGSCQESQGPLSGTWTVDQS